MTGDVSAGERARLESRPGDTGSDDRPMLTRRRSSARVVTEPRAKGTDMAGYRTALPQLADSVFLTDGGIETTLIFHDGLDLPEFAAFVLLADETGREALLSYFRRYAAIARDAGCGFILEAPTWRANPDWAAKLGYSPEMLDAANRAAIDLMVQLRREFETPGHTRGHQRLRRTAQRRVPTLRADDPGGGAALPRHPDRHLRRHRGRPGHGDHDDAQRRGDRRGAGRRRQRAARRDLVHRRDRRQPAVRRVAGRGHRGGGRRDRRAARRTT